MRSLVAVLKGVVARRRRGGEGEVLMSHSYRGRVSLMDMDVNFHLNNAKLLSLTEFARWNWVAESGLLNLAMRNRYVILLGSQAVRYRRELYAFQKYEIRNEVAAADDRWLWVRGTITTPGSGSVEQPPAACTLHRVMLKQGKETVDPLTLLRKLGFEGQVPTPQDDPEIRGFLAWDGEVKAREKQVY